MAPLELVEFPKKVLRCGNFEIRSFKTTELDELLQTQINRIFYRYAVVDAEALSPYWFVVVTKKNIRGRWKKGAFFSYDEQQIERRYPTYPEPVDQALRELALFDWEPNYGSSRNEWFGFEVPFVLRIDDDLLRQPQSAPDVSKLSMTTVVDQDGYEHEEPVVQFDIDESQASRLESLVRDVNEFVSAGGLDVKEWHFLEIALGNLLKAFFSGGLEQLLWHVTVLESVLSEQNRDSLTTLLAQRIAALVEDDPKQRAVTQKQFKDLYEARSALVHGRKIKKVVLASHLRQARKFARSVVLRFAYLLRDIHAGVANGEWKKQRPTREDLLLLVDFDALHGELSKVFDRVPQQFPKATGGRES